MPPVTVPRVIDPFEAPHVALVTFVTMAVGPLASVIVADVENIQPFTSFTSTAYVPAAKLGYTSVAVNALPFTEYV